MPKINYGSLKVDGCRDFGVEYSSKLLEKAHLYLRELEKLPKGFSMDDSESITTPVWHGGKILSNGEKLHLAFLSGMPTEE